MEGGQLALEYCPNKMARVAADLRGSQDRDVNAETGCPRGRFLEKEEAPAHEAPVHYSHCESLPAF